MYLGCLEILAHDHHDGLLLQALRKGVVTQRVLKWQAWLENETLPVPEVPKKACRLYSKIQQADYAALQLSRPIG